ncbi:hypothetical protein HDU76_000388 [Blyttiomyces sp. JEL0837]|nr:hypothetical protein HDU76_000388 [Blyttiomyces sp. JEL0837]
MKATQVALLAAVLAAIRVKGAPLWNAANMAVAVSSAFANGEAHLPVTITTPAIDHQADTHAAAAQPTVDNHNHIDTTTTTTTTTSTQIPQQPPLISSSGYPIPDPTYNITATGLVTILMLHNQATGSRGKFLNDAQTAFTSSSENNNDHLRIEWRVFPEHQDYGTYLSQLKKACDGKVKGLFDLVWVEASQVGELGDCFVDLLGWDAEITDGILPAAVQNSMHHKRLVTLPVEANVGILYSNNDILARYGLSGPPETFQDLEYLSSRVLVAERSMDNYQLSGYTGQLSGEGLTTHLVEWLYGHNKSTIIDPVTGEVSIYTNAVATVLQRIGAWSDNYILDSAEMDLTPGPPSYLTSATSPDPASDPAVYRFLDGKALFMRHWASVGLTTFKDLSIDFNVGIGPVVGMDDKSNVGALGGWGIAVYRYSENPKAAVKVARWLASKEMQKALVVQGGVPAIPVSVALYDDPEVCARLSDDLCRIMEKITPSLRPTTQTGSLYKNITAGLYEILPPYIRGDSSQITPTLHQLDTTLRKILNQTNTNTTINVTDDNRKGKVQPNHLEVQLGGLLIVILVSAVVVFLLRQKAIYEQQKKAGMLVREDPDNGVNEFQVAEDEEDEEEDDDDDEKAGKKGGLAKKAGKIGKSGGGPEMEVLKTSEHGEFVA